MRRRGIGAALIDNEASQQAHTALGFEEIERVVLFRKALR